MTIGYQELDRRRCSNPACDHTAHDGLFLHGRCHPRRGVEVEYRAKVLHIRCKICKAKVVDVAVAEGAGQCALEQRYADADTAEAELKELRSTEARERRAEERYQLASSAADQWCTVAQESGEALRTLGAKEKARDLRDAELREAFHVWRGKKLSDAAVDVRLASAFDRWTAKGGQACWCVAAPRQPPNPECRDCGGSGAKGGKAGGDG